MVRLRIVSLLLIPYIVLCFLESLPREGRPNDLGIFLTSGRAVVEQTNPYLSDTNFTNFNPPISLILFAPLSQFEVMEVFPTWYIVSLFIYICSLGLLAKYHPNRYDKWLWAFSLTSLWTTLSQGQIYMPLLLITVSAWILMEKGKRIGAGVLIGLLIAIKPNFALWSVLLLLGGYSLMAIISFIIAGLISLIPIFVYGPGIYRQWLASNGIWTEMMDKPANGSILGLVARLDIPELGVIVGGVLVIFVVYLVWCMKPSVLDVTSLGIITSLIVSPIAWPGYVLLLLPVFISIKQWTFVMKVVSTLMVIPILFVQEFIYSDPLIYKTLGSFYSITLLLIFVDILLRVMRSHKELPSSIVRAA